LVVSGEEEGRGERRRRDKKDSRRSSREDREEEEWRTTGTRKGRRASTATGRGTGTNAEVGFFLSS